MSFDLYLQAFRLGEPAGLPIQEVRDAFGPELLELEEDFWQVRYAPDQSSDLFLQPLPGQPQLIHCLSIHRPCTDSRLFEAAWRLLGMTGTVLYFPGCAEPLARDLLAGAAMPSDMRRSLGAPTVIARAADIPLAIGNC